MKKNHINYAAAVLSGAALVGCSSNSQRAEVASAAAHDRAAHAQDTPRQLDHESDAQVLRDAEPQPAHMAQRDSHSRDSAKAEAKQREDAPGSPPEHPEQQPDEPLDVLRGKATYYAQSFAGQVTASGETYDPAEMTAAAKRLPLGSVVRVVRRDADAAVQVRINDRLPKRMGASIDLSRAAAEKLGMIEEGIVPVRIEVLAFPDKTAQ